MPKNPAEDYLTVKQVAEMKGVSVQTVYKAIERENLKAITLLEKTVIRRADADAYNPRPRRSAMRAGQGAGEPSAEATA